MCAQLLLHCLGDRRPLETPGSRGELPLVLVLFILGLFLPYDSIQLS